MLDVYLSNFESRKGVYYMLAKAICIAQFGSWDNIIVDYATILEKCSKFGIR